MGQANNIIFIETTSRITFGIQTMPIIEMAKARSHKTDAERSLERIACRKTQEPTPREPGTREFTFQRVRHRPHSARRLDQRR